MLLELVPMVGLEEVEDPAAVALKPHTHVQPIVGIISSTGVGPAACGLKKTLEYTDKGLQSIEPDVLYVQALKNQMAFDSFI